MKRALPLLLFALAAFAVSCGRQPPPAAPAKELETVDVTAAPDAELSIEGDAQERRATAALAGALPDGFPSDIPVTRPASLVDFGERPGGGHHAVFDSPDSREAVAGGQRSRLRGAGWREAGGNVWTKGERRIELSVEARPGGSRVTILY